MVNAPLRFVSGARSRLSSHRRRLQVAAILGLLLFQFAPATGRPLPAPLLPAIVHASGTTDTVSDCNDDGGPGNIREVIANASSGDTIVFDCSGNGFVDDLNSDNGQIEITNNLTIDGCGVPGQTPCTQQTTLQDNNGSLTLVTRILVVDAGIQVTVENVEFQDGSPAVDGENGGAIDNSGTLTVDSCDFATNSTGGASSNGGAIANETGGVLTVTNSTFNSNSVGHDEFGGAIYNASGGTLTIDHSTFVGNTADIEGDGGAVYSAGQLTSVTNSSFTNGDTFTSDNTNGLGAAIDADYQGPGTFSTSFTDDYFASNRAEGPSPNATNGGGALYIGPNNLAAISNSTFYSNSANGHGEAIYSQAPLSLSFDTIAFQDQSPGNAPAITMGDIGLQGMRLAGNIIENYLGNCDSTNPSGGVPVEVGTNLWSDYADSSPAAAVATCGLPDPVTLNTGLSGEVGPFGGPTFTANINRDSAAEGAVSPCTDVNGNQVALDQRGVSRPAIACSAGSYEVDDANDRWTSPDVADTIDGSDPNTAANAEVDQTFTQHIYTPGEERWYRVKVFPGSKLTISYTGPTGDPGHVVSLHSDLLSAYNALTDNPNTPQVSALETSGSNSANALPQGFAFTSLPQGFAFTSLPQGFAFSSLPQGFAFTSLPQGFAFTSLPQGVLFDSFPQGQLFSSLPQGPLFNSLPSGIKPGPYLGAAYVSALAVSAEPGNTQTIVHDTYGDYGYEYVGVAGSVDSANPYTLKVVETGGACAGVTAPTPFTPPVATGTSAQTLMLWDPTHFDQTSAAFQTMQSDLTTFAGYQGTTAAAAVNGQLVDLSQIPGIDTPMPGAAQSAEDLVNAYPACPEAKNFLAADIKAVVDAYRVVDPIKNIVLIGDDSSIPYFRFPDQSGFFGESEYVPPVDHESSAYAALQGNFVLNQDSYGSTKTLQLGDDALPVPDIPVGRLVKTPAQIDTLLTTYMTHNGELHPTKSLAMGYDFVASAATATAGYLTAGIGTPPSQLIDAAAPGDGASAWTEAQQRQLWLHSGRHDITFIAGHFSAGGTEPADYPLEENTFISPNDLATSTTDMSNTLVFTLGCHSGYEIPQNSAIAQVSPDPNWPEAMAGKGATLLASTGYAYGSDQAVVYGSQVFSDTVKYLMSVPAGGGGYQGMSVGAAEVAAKQDYLTDYPELNGVDEKTLLETTLFGLPMMRVVVPNPQTITTLPSIVSGTTSVAGGPGQPVSLSTADLDLSPGLQQHTQTMVDSSDNPFTETYDTGTNTATLNGGGSHTTVDAFGGQITQPTFPVQPLQSFNVHVPNQVLRGVGFRGGAYSDTTGITPFTAGVAAQNGMEHVNFTTPTFYPEKVGLGNIAPAMSGGNEQLATIPAQYISSDPSSASGTLREYSDLQLRLYYLPGAWSDGSGGSPDVVNAAGSSPLQIGDVSATADGSGNVTFEAHVADNPAGAQAVWVTYTDPKNPGAWTSVDLSPAGGGDSSLWTATATVPSSALFMVQAASGSGLVTLDSNSDRYYTVDAPAAVPTLLTVIGPTSGAFGSTQEFSVSLSTAPPPPFAARTSHRRRPMTSGPSGIGGQVVAVTVGDSTGFGVTDASGNASVDVHLVDAPSPNGYDVGAAYPGGRSTDGNTEYAPGLAPVQSGAFTITTAPTALDLSPLGGVTDPSQIIAKLTSNGNPLADKPLVFTIQDTNSSKVFYQSAITDVTGQASPGHVALPDGTYDVTAQFGGNAIPIDLIISAQHLLESDADYDGITSSSIALTVSGATYAPAPCRRGQVPGLQNCVPRSPGHGRNHGTGNTGG
jgi:hypothetical protein